jgi:hypothetical protein
MRADAVQLKQKQCKNEYKYLHLSLLQCATIWKCEQRLSIENTDEICYKIILGNYFFG